MIESGTRVGIKKWQVSMREHLLSIKLPFDFQLLDIVYHLVYYPPVIQPA